MLDGAGQGARRSFERDGNKKAPSRSGLRAQFDRTISPIGDLQSTVKQECCAILCDVAQDQTARIHRLPRQRGDGRLCYSVQASELSWNPKLSAVRIAVGVASE